MVEHPEITAELNRSKRCLVVTVAGGSKTATFRTADPAATLWSGNSPCPAWAQEAVRSWTKTPGARALYQQLALALGKDPRDFVEEITANDRR